MTTICVTASVERSGKMRTGALVVFFSYAMLIWSSAVVSEEKSSDASKLGYEIFQKQKSCEEIIEKEIDEIVNDEESDPRTEIPIPDEDYHDCKEKLDEMKRKYMKIHNIEESPDVEFFPVKIYDGYEELVAVPGEEGADVRDLEFDVTQELCVNSKKCTSLREAMEKENDPKQKQNYKNKYNRCDILLEPVKHKYIKEKKLDEEKLKKDDGLVVTCTGGNIKETLPPAINNLDYNTQPHELFDGALQNNQPIVEEATSVSEEQESHLGHPAEETVKGHANHEEASNTVKGTPSKAAVERINLVSFVVVAIAFVIVT